MKAAIRESFQQGVQNYLITPLSKGSLVRYLLVRLVPALIMLILLDLLMTWLIIRQSFISAFALENILVLVIISQVILIVVFGLFVWVSVRAGIELIRDISKQIDMRGETDLQPIVLPDVPTEMIPVIDHINDLFYRLNEALEAQRRFIAHAAHQLRTPLTALRLESEMMLSRDLPVEVRDRAQRILATSNRMIRLGEQLLLLARANPDIRPKDVFSTIELCEWLREFGSQWWQRVTKKGIDFEIELPENEKVWILGDKLLLEELVGNLIDNALKYSNSTKIILRVNANPVVLTVEDNGIGIEPSEQSQVFEPFFRSAKTNVSGSGLGLQIVREIARAHGASCRLESLPHYSGTSVHIQFPSY